MLSAGIAAIAAAALAQDAGQMRGGFDQAAGVPPGQQAQAQARNMQPAPGTGTIPNETYLPVSTGAVPEERPIADENGELFADVVGDREDREDLQLPEIESRTPSTASRRREAEEDAAVAADAREQLRATREGAVGQFEEDLATGTVRAARVEEEDLRLDAGAERAEPIEGLDAVEEENPYAPLGMRLGSFRFDASVEQGLTATSNASSSAGGKSAVLSETTLRLDGASDWSRHSATIGGYTTYRKTVSGEEIDELDGRLDAALNLDLAGGYGARVALGYEAGPESASSPIVIDGSLDQPLRQTLDGSLRLSKGVGKLEFAATGAIEHDWYGDADLSTGGTLSQAHRDSTLYSLILRGGYEVSPAIRPFIEGEVGRRVYDQTVDPAGYERSALRTGARAGVALSLDEKVEGELSAGWIRESLDDDRLDDISAATLAADLRWSPERGTTVGLNADTTVEGATSAGESGSVRYSGRLTLERQVRANLTANAELGAAWRDYASSGAHDLELFAQVGGTWWLNRHLGITTRARHQRIRSNIDGRDSETSSIFLGLRAQR